MYTYNLAFQPEIWYLLKQVNDQDKDDINNDYDKCFKAEYLFLY